MVIAVIIGLCIFIKTSAFWGIQNEVIWYTKPQNLQTNFTKTSKAETLTQAKHNVFFLKTHKTGGTTIAGILARFALNNNLTVAIGKDIKKGMPQDKNGLPKIYYRTRTGKYNIWLRHLLGNGELSPGGFSKKRWGRLFFNDTKYLTILREPLANFESLFYYNKSAQPYFKNPCFKGSSESLELFVKNPHKYTNCAKSYRWWSLQPLPRNPMSMDLGLTAGQHSSVQKIHEVIKTVEKGFDLVMLTEYFDESLILLRDLMNWSYEDIMYFKVRTRAERHTVSSEAASVLRKWNAADELLYAHFNSTFWKKVDAFSVERMHQEVKQFRIYQEQWYNFCVDRIDSTGLHEEYILTEEGKDNVKCQRLKNFFHSCLKDIVTSMCNHHQLVKCPQPEDIVL